MVTGMGVHVLTQAIRQLIGGDRHTVLLLVTGTHVTGLVDQLTAVGRESGTGQTWGGDEGWEGRRQGATGEGEGNVRRPILYKKTPPWLSVDQPWLLLVARLTCAQITREQSTIGSFAQHFGKHDFLGGQHDPVLASDSHGSPGVFNSFGGVLGLVHTAIGGVDGGGVIVSSSGG